MSFTKNRYMPAIVFVWGAVAGVAIMGIVLVIGASVGGYASGWFAAAAGAPLFKLTCARSEDADSSSKGFQDYLHDLTGLRQIVADDYRSFLTTGRCRKGANGPAPNSDPSSQCSDQNSSTPLNETCFGQYNDTYDDLDAFWGDDVVGRLFSYIGRIAGRNADDRYQAGVKDGVAATLAFLGGPDVNAAIYGALYFSAIFVLGICATKIIEHLLSRLFRKRADDGSGRVE
ncbi:hypothetical protein [Paraburkholderia sp.]|uniref:hypothetical protein n=1 Tax=Paraburkholderia sp. TaxID=1926495 RepID=UPI00286EC747|nr:hypothetical protein [Paraburkholderia sp.]